MDMTAFAPVFRVGSYSPFKAAIGKVEDTKGLQATDAEGSDIYCQPIQIYLRLPHSPLRFSLNPRLGPPSQHGR